MYMYVVYFVPVPLNREQIFYMIVWYILVDRVTIIELDKYCELKGGIVEKVQETRFGMSLKYSRYIGIAS